MLPETHFEVSELWFHEDVSNCTINCINQEFRSVSVTVKQNITTETHDVCKQRNWEEAIINHCRSGGMTLTPAAWLVLCRPLGRMRQWATTFVLCPLVAYPNAAASRDVQSARSRLWATNCVSERTATLRCPLLPFLRRVRERNGLEMAPTARWTFSYVHCLSSPGVPTSVYVPVPHSMPRSRSTAEELPCLLDDVSFTSGSITTVLQCIAILRCDSGCPKILLDAWLENSPRHVTACGRQIPISWPPWSPGFNPFYLFPWDVWKPRPVPEQLIPQRNCCTDFKNLEMKHKIYPEFLNSCGSFFFSHRAERCVRKHEGRFNTSCLKARQSCPHT
jgi:hypothetical protein